MLAHPYAIGGFSYAGIWAFYGLTQGLRESKSPQKSSFFVKRSLRGLFCNRVFQCVIHHLSNPKMKMLKKRMLRTSLNRQLSMLPVAVDAFEPACWEFGPWLIVFLPVIFLALAWHGIWKTLEDGHHLREDAAALFPLQLRKRAAFRGHGATVQIKQVGLTRSLRIPYAFLTRKNTFFFQNWEPPIKVHGKTCIYHISVYICTLIICCKLVCAIPVVSFLQQVFTARFPFHLTVINVTKHIDPHVSFIL